MFVNEYVSRVEVNILRRTFTIFGCDGTKQELTCDDADQFTNVLNVTRTATEVDEEIELVYIS
mgnify:CR=1 FL=1|tara:strand:- start:238 stop:426 length:189 start_codon:yes stop_codon:yes gene_type:complete